MYHITVSSPGGWSQLWRKNHRIWQHAVNREKRIKNAILKLGPLTQVKLVVDAADPRTSVVWLLGDQNDVLPWADIWQQRDLVGGHPGQPSISL